MTKYAFIIGGILILNGCSGLTPRQTEPAPAKTLQVDILKFKFLPAEIILSKGDTIIWVNQENRQYHSVWFQKQGEAEPDYLFPGDTLSRKFEETGNFPYRCGPHPEMRATVIVK